MSEKVRHNEEKLKMFMSIFNMKFIGHNCSTYDLFIRNSLLEDGGLYLQPYVVMLNKYLLSISEHDSELNDDEFKEVLGILYQHQLTDDLCIKRFVQYYDENTRECYIDTWYDMMNHLFYLYTNQLSATMSLNDKIGKLIANAMNEESHEALWKSLERMRDEDIKTHYIEMTLNIYTDVLVNLQVIMQTRATKEHYYVLNNDNYYEIFTGPLDESFMQHLPDIIFKLVGNQPEITDNLVCKLWSMDTPAVDDHLLFCNSTFQFATSVGTFNSLLGMYTANTRFLRYDRYRYAAIWKLHVVRMMYTRQNYDILERLKATEKYAKLMHENVGSLFVHLLFAPAIIQLRNWTHPIDEFRIAKLMNLLMRYEDLSSAYFLVEYFPIDPTFIYLIMYIHQSYDGFSTMETYEEMKTHILKEKKLDANTWQAYFRQELESVTFEEKESYMDTLYYTWG
ncbi:unnamed protein product [Xylocopa violacea]|uniref:Uncharacterized protein n=1 Tax=Xylocopa violacea TaxID=135666 RepID=A0ABP1N0Y9_XYLVO